MRLEKGKMTQPTTSFMFVENVKQVAKVALMILLALHLIIGHLGNLQSLWWGKLGRQGAICWLKKELSMVHGTLNIFFRNKTFLFVKIEIWNFQHLFDLLFHETSQNFSSFRQLLFPVEKCCLNVCLNELKFCKVSRNPKSNSCWKFQLSILTNKKVLFLKKYEVYHVSWVVLSSANRCRSIFSQLS